jgi:hypothetical protein
VDDDEVKEAVHESFVINEKNFYSGIKKLEDRWAPWIEKKGDYIEKRLSSNVCKMNTDFKKVWKLFEVPL